MNELIQELADRLWRIHPKDIDAMGLKTRKEFYEQELKKFAEYIVRECIDQISVNHDPNSDWDWEVSRGNAIAIIKEHFGVEE